MKIAILSDIHDNIWNLKRVLKEIKEVEAIIFCGDMGSPASAKLLFSLNVPIYAVFGNVDGAHFEITNWVKDNAPHVKLFKVLGEIELGNRRIAFCHYPKFAKALAFTGKYDVVFCGHKHSPSVEKIGKTLLARPGEIMAFHGKCNFGIYDTEKNEMEIKEL